ncbi:MAG: hypothetical protein DWQ05_09605 [Calditrichaeota bacterium]|nr:MAG: hypothetical protein DWQ05_09605 [Calditrichota bacterium]
MTAKAILPSAMLTIVLLFLFSPNSAECQNISSKVKLPAIYQVTYAKAMLNAGALLMPVYSNGIFGETKYSGHEMYIDPNSQLNILYHHSLIIGGILHHNDSSSVRVRGARYQSELQPGMILSPGIVENPEDDEVNRVWRIRRDIYEDSYNLQDNMHTESISVYGLSREQVTQTEINELLALYKEDWLEWPVDKGAPFYDVDGDGKYSPEFRIDSWGNEIPKMRPAPGEYFDPGIHADEPGLHNADQVIYFVANDLLPDSSSGGGRTITSPPLGLEFHFTTWAYSSGSNQKTQLSNSVFHRARFVFKGTSETATDAFLDSLFIGIFADLDLGDFGDDLVGYDRELELGFSYNENIDDSNFLTAGYAPPAAGYILLAGPVIPEPGSDAFWGSGQKADFTNLSTYAFTHDGGPFSVFFNDPAAENRFPFLGTWNLLRGFQEHPIMEPTPFFTPDGEETKFSVTGDPISKSGWLDKEGGDRRILMSAGPFSMALGDSNEITYALSSGLGYDRISSLGLARRHARVAKSYHKNGFQIPESPPNPIVTATIVGDRILLTWEYPDSPIDFVDTWESGGHIIEGFKIYQHDPEQSWERKIIATYDKKNDFSTITGMAYDREVFAYTEQILASGNNEGLQFHHFISSDAFGPVYKPLVREKEYLFSVSAYSVHPDPAAIPRSLESYPKSLTVRIDPKKLGQRFHSATGDTIPVIHSSGESEFSVSAVIIDPTAITGQDYQITFTEKNDVDFLWNLQNLTTERFIFENQHKFGAEYNIVIDGFGLHLPSNNSAGFKRLDNGNPAIIEIANENGPLGEDDFDTIGAPFSGNQVWHSLNAGGYGDRYFLSTTTTGEKGLKLNGFLARSFDLELQFTELNSGSLALWQDETTGPVPFQLWLIPHDESRNQAIQLIPVLHSGAGTIGVFSPDYGPDGYIGFPAFDRINWHMPAAGKSYSDFAAAVSAGTGITSTIGDSVLTGLLVCDFDGNSAPPQPGSIIRFFTVKSFTEADVFTFSTAGMAPTRSEAQAKVDAQQLINVFPNPYYGLFNLDENRETRFVTFTHLPQKAKIQIYTLSGVLVRTLEKSDDLQYLKWDLTNESGRLVGNGLFIAKIELPELGVEKILKLVVVHK